MTPRQIDAEEVKKLFQGFINYQTMIHGGSPESIKTAECYAEEAREFEYWLADGGLIELLVENERLTQERDAAIADISRLIRECECEHRHDFCASAKDSECSGHWPGDCSGAKWRGTGGAE